MRVTTPAFRRYVALADNGYAQLWRIVLGVAVVIALWMSMSVVTLVAGYVLSGYVPAVPWDPGAAMQGFIRTSAGVASVLASFLGMSAGVLVAVRFVHRRPCASVLGAEGRLVFADFWRGLAAAIFIAGILFVPSVLFDPSLERSDISLGVWLLWLGPVALLLLIQVSAEEMAFRGYLVQSLAARFAAPLIWAVVPVALFATVHWEGHTEPAMMAGVLVWVAAFGMAATVLVARTGNISAGIGAHLGVNLFPIVFVSHTDWLSGLALYKAKPIDTGMWTEADAVTLAVLGIVQFVLLLVLLLWRRSPLCVQRLDLPIAGTISVMEANGGADEYRRGGEGERAPREDHSLL